MRSHLGTTLLLVLLTTAAACGGSSTYSISGNVSGAADVILSLTGAANANVTTDPSGNYQFSALSDGSYTVTPSKAGFSFDPMSVSVTVSGANVTDQNFAATALARAYSVGGTLSGLGSGLNVVLQNNGGDDLTLSENGLLVFASELLDSATYNVTVLTTPMGQTCTVSNGTGTIRGAAVTDIAVTCVDNPVTYSISGKVSGAPLAVTLTLSGEASATTTSAAGAYSFASLPNGSYRITPNLKDYTFEPDKIDVIINEQNVTDQNFTASLIHTYPVGGTLSGLGAGLAVLLHNTTEKDTERFCLGFNGPFSFVTEVADGASYSVTVSIQPSGQTCTVSNDTGTISGAAVTDIAVTCMDN
jgi:hypothetical protein